MKTTLLALVIGLFGSLIILTSCGNAEYDEAITKADQLFVAKKYVDAKKVYESALKLEPEEEHPKARIEEIKKILADIAAKKAIEDEKKYKEFVAKADELYEAKKYNDAKGYYEQALSFKPNEKHAKDRLEWINNYLAELASMKNNPYHIILGCFEVPRNALNYHDKIKNEFSQHSRSFPIAGGTLEAVTYKSYKTLSEAYNALPEAQKIDPNAWVMKRRL